MLVCVLDGQVIVGDRVVWNSTQLQATATAVVMGDSVQVQADFNFAVGVRTASNDGMHP